PFFFELFHKSSNLENGQVTELVHQFICICHFLFLVSLPPIAFGELMPTAIASYSFASLLFRHLRSKFLMSSFMLTHTLSLISPSTGARARSLVHSTNGRGASPETRAVPAIAPAKLRAAAGQRVFPIPPWKERFDRQNRS